MQSPHRCFAMYNHTVKMQPCSAACLKMLSSPSWFWFCIKMARREDLSDFERGFIIGAQKTGAVVTKTAQPASTGKVTKVASAFRSMGLKISVNRVGNRGRLCTFAVEDVIRLPVRTVCWLLKIEMDIRAGYMKLSLQRWMYVHLRVQQKLFHRYGKSDMGWIILHPSTLTQRTQGASEWFD